MKKLAEFFTNLPLMIFSIFFTLILIEISLRFIRPEYQYAAEAKFIISQSRIWQNPRKTRAYRMHPELGKRHLVIYNSFGFRQHREFNPKKADDVIRIGFFGDSFTENLRMEAQYSFTEPLEYLLNKTGVKYEIMNFGTDSYGTDQVFLQYLQEGTQMGLDIVFYVYCNNDLRNINENDLLTIDKKGNIKAVRYVTHPFVKFINKFYITYLIMDVNDNIKNKLFSFESKRYRDELEKRFHAPEYEAIEKDFAKGIITPDVDKTLRIYFAILSKLEIICKNNKTKFYIATVPYKSANSMSHLLIKKGFKTINLYDKFRTIYLNQEYSFKNHGHWNEEGNKLAAIFLFKYLAKELDIAYSGDEFIEQGLYEYYSSFSPSRVTAFFLKKHHDFSANLNHKIRNRYLGLEQFYLEK